MLTKHLVQILVSTKNNCPQVIGEHRIILGSDYPFPLGEHHPGKLIEATDLPDSLKKQLLFDNALEFLNLDASQFS